MSWDLRDVAWQHGVTVGLVTWCCMVTLRCVVALCYMVALCCEATGLAQPQHK
jgi:hypothetical protein